MSELHLPQERRIDQAKVVEYLLHPVKGHGKAHLFYKIGFTMLGWKLLRDALLVHADSVPVTEAVGQTLELSTLTPEAWVPLMVGTHCPSFERCGYRTGDKMASDWLLPTR